MSNDLTRGDKSASHEMMAIDPIFEISRALRSASIIAPAMLLLAAVAPTAEDDALNPGLWRVRIDLEADTANGKPLGTPHHEHEEQVGCFSSRDNIAELFAEKTLPQGCHTYQVHADRGDVSFTAICSPDEDGVSMDMSGAGKYSGDQMSMKIDARAESDGDQATMSGMLTAIRLGECPTRE